jgi:seryl-tRNA synthetase
MLDPKIIRDNTEDVKKSIINRRMGDGSTVDTFLELDSRFNTLQREIETKRALRNSLSEAISKVAAGDRQKLIDEASAVKTDLKTLEEEFAKVEAEIRLLQGTFPNLVDSSVTVGKDDSENVVVRTSGTPTKFDFEPKDHITLGEALSIIDVENASKVSGSRFYYLKGAGALLEFALIHFCMKTLTNASIIKELANKVGSPYSNVFSPVIPPVFIRPEVMKKMDRLDPIEERYYIPSDDLVIVAA